MAESGELYSLGGKRPELGAGAWVAPGAQVIGDVHLGEKASVWFNAVLRADIDRIDIGAGSNIQDGSVLHVDEGYPIRIGPDVTVGHKVMLHGCTIDEGALIGINAVILNGAHIGAHSIVGANALVTEGKLFPARSLILGAPAKVVRTLGEHELAMLADAGSHYVHAASLYAEGLERI
ncbi:MAG: gamma carbonic anhydrase family protein [Pseudomonadota bacterium]